MHIIKVECFKDNLVNEIKLHHTPHLEKQSNIMDKTCLVSWRQKTKVPYDQQDEDLNAKEKAWEGVSSAPCEDGKI